MNMMIAFSLIIGIIIIYVFFIEVFVILFRITGLPENKARFQVTSLLTNCGFTTEESELITENRKRRRLARFTMLTGYAFSVIFVSLIVNLFFSLSDQAINDSYPIFVIGAIILLSLIIIRKTKFATRPISRLIEKIGLRIMIGKKTNEILVIDRYGSNVIAEVRVKELPECMVNKKIKETGLRENYNINVLTFKRDRDDTKVALADTIIEKNDIIIILGSYKNIVELFYNLVDKKNI